MQSLTQVLCVLMLALLTCKVQSRGGLLSKDSMATMKPSEPDYYEQFTLDYGSDDNSRIAGSLRGFIKVGQLSKLPQSDHFVKWLCEHLEKGHEPAVGRVKPFYAADFGTKADLKKGEHPKIIIVNRKLAADADGLLAAPPADVDVEVRTIWQPWLRHKCNFVARYIVPNRVNIISIMEHHKQFVSELELVKASNKDEKSTAFAKMTFKPTLLERLKGKKNVVIRKELDASRLQ